VAAWGRDICRSRGWQPPPAYSIIFPREQSEEAVQRGVARTLGLPQTFLTVDEYSEPPGLFRRAIEYSAWTPWPAEFVYGPIFQALAGRAREDGCQALMTGDGGDELLTVSPTYSADMLRDGDLAGMIQLVRVLIRYWKGSAGAAVSSVFWTNGIRAIARDAIWKKMPKLARRRHRRLLPKALPDWLAPDPAIRRELVDRYDNRWGRTLNKGSFYLTQLNYGREHPLPDRSFQEQFYRNASAGMFVAAPYWDRPLAEFLLRTHPKMLNASGRWKSLIRGAMAVRFPSLGFEKQKKVVSEDKLLMRRESRPLWEWLGPRRALAEMGVVDCEGYNRMLERSFEADDILKMYRAWHGATAEYWARRRV
jgi:asparagine synthetase B (glutamine-hydrolysing)